MFVHLMTTGETAQVRPVSGALLLVRKQDGSTAWWRPGKRVIKEIMRAMERWPKAEEFEVGVDYRIERRPHFEVTVLPVADTLDH